MRGRYVYPTSCSGYCTSCILLCNTRFTVNKSHSTAVMFATDLFNSVFIC